MENAPSLFPAASPTGWSATSAVLVMPGTDSPLPTIGSFSKHLVRLSASKPAWLLGSSKAKSLRGNESSLALGPGLVIPALLGAYGCLSLRGQLGPGATPSSPFRVQVTIGRVSLTVGWRKDFRISTPSMGVGSGVALSCPGEGLHCLACGEPTPGQGALVVTQC